MQQRNHVYELFDEYGRMRILDGMRYYKKIAEENNMPRVEIVMAEKVDGDCLQYAAELAMQRFCVPRLVVVQDESRFYLKQNNQKPVVHVDNGERHVVCTKDNNDHLTWIGYRDSVITLEFFHGVSDGKGMIPFLQTLLYHYCQKKYGDIMPDIPGLSLDNAEEDASEYMESIRFLPQTPVDPGEKYQWQRALQLKGKHMASESACYYYSLRADAETFENYMRANASSRSAVFATFMNQAVACHHTVGEDPVVAALAVNARQAYEAEQTMQCCVSTIPIWLDQELLALPESERLKLGRQMILEGTKKENIISAAMKTRDLNQYLEMKCPTLEEKKSYCRMLTDSGNDRYTYGLSYIGELKFGEAIDAHINSVNVKLCANTIPVILEVVKYKGHYYINYCTHFEEDPYLQSFQQMFLDAGIPCSCINHGIYDETLAIF